MVNNNPKHNRQLLILFFSNKSSLHPPLEKGGIKGCHSRESGSPEPTEKTGFLLEFIPMKIGAGMTRLVFYGVFRPPFLFGGAKIKF